MNRHPLGVTRCVVVFAVFLWLASSAYAATLHVSNRGTDGPSCGSTANRCRSITQAIANAAPGDTIMVGPGRYGDLDSDGVLGEPGEEIGSPGCGCMLSINKPVILQSTDGAAATVIDAASVEVNTNVLIIAVGVEFGRPNRGFTVTQTRMNAFRAGDGIVIDGSDVKVRGNQVVVVNPPIYPEFITGRYGISTVFNDFETILIESNQVIGWEQGMVIRGARKAVSRNHVSYNFRGIDVDGGSGAAGTISVSGNVIGSNFDGIRATGAVSIAGNAVHGNQIRGIQVASGFSGTIAKNNIFGNGTFATAGGIQNCGLANALPGLIATNNYWGASTGPGPDPADTVCHSGGGTTSTSPFATAPFAVNPEFEP